MRILRVFPRRTSFTPTDSLAFVGNPPLDRPEADEVHVSTTFTWDIARAQYLQAAWAQYYPVVKIGGPAFATPVVGFTPGLYVKPGVVFTSRGCNHHCPWCLVPGREGSLKLITPIPEGNIIQDNNFLQTPRSHQETVFEMLRKQQTGACFKGGLESRLVTDWFAEQCRTIKIRELWFACDTDAALEPLRAALEKFRWTHWEKLRCYVLLGFNGESLEAGVKRLKAVYSLGCFPFAQVWRPHDRVINYPPEWGHVTRAWTRPAITKAMMKP